MARIQEPHSTWLPPALRLVSSDANAKGIACAAPQGASSPGIKRPHNHETEEIFMIRSLQHVGIAVPDLEVGRAFYEAFGLEAIPQSDRITMRCAGRAQDQVV